MPLTFQPTSSDVAADAVAVAARLAESEERLRDALLAGAPTRDVHAEIVALRAAAARIAAADADAQAAAEAHAAQAHQARVSEAAARYASDIAQRLANRLAALAPLPFSLTPPFRTTTR